MRFYISLSALFFLLVASSCATILSKTKKSVYINANVQGAKIFDEKNQLLGSTPMRYFPTKIETKKLIIEKEGYASQSVTLNYTEKLGFVILDAMLLCIPCLVDYPTKNIYSFDKDSINVKLQRVFKDDVPHVSLIIDDAQWQIKDGSVIGKDRKELIYFKKSHFDSYLYKEAFCKASAQSRYTILNCGRTENSDFKYIGKSNTYMAVANFKTLQIEKGYKNSEWLSNISYDAEITFSKSGKTIKTVPVSLRQKGVSIENKPLIAVMLYDAIINIFNNDTIYDELIKLKQDTSLSTYKRLELANIKLPEFSKNKDLFKHLMKGVVTIEHDKGHGSGFIISQDGYIITNYHVIKNKQIVNIKFNESITLAADVVRGDAEYDVALLKLSGNGFTSLPMIHSDSISSGEDVFAIGTPEDISLGQSVTKGIVSGKRKFEDKIYIQTDVTINSGNSGGPLLNEKGQVVGMVTMKLVGDGVEGLGFCVPSNQIMEILNITYK